MRIRVLDMFCGAGGSSAGARMAGASVVHGIDEWVLAAQTFQDNFCDAKVDIRELGPDSRPPCSLRRGDIEMLFASRNAPFTVLRKVLRRAERAADERQTMSSTSLASTLLVGTMNERAKMRRFFQGAADTPLRHCTPPNQAMLVSSPHALSV